MVVVAVMMAVAFACKGRARHCSSIAMVVVAVMMAVAFACKGRARQAGDKDRPRAHTCTATRTAASAYVHPVLTKDFKRGRPLCSYRIAAQAW